MALIAWWPLNGNLYDRSRKFNHLTYQNNNGKLVQGTGKTGGCYKRNSSNDGADCLRSTYMIDLREDFTIACWAYVTNAEEIANGLVTNHHYPSNAGAGITTKRISSSDYRISCNTGTGSDRTYETYYGTTNIKNAWHHLAVRFKKSTNEMSLWVNGVNENTFTYAQYNIETYFEIFQWSVGQNFTNYKPACSLCDIRVYNHALCEKEFRELMKVKVAHYKFDSFVEPTTNLYRGENSSLGGSMTTLASGWLSLNTGPNGHGWRFYAYLNMLTNGATYTGAMDIYNPNTYSVTVSLDWCDQPASSTTLAPYETKRHFTTAARSSYDSTFRFLDITGTANATVLLKDIQIEKKYYPTPYYPGNMGARTNILYDDTGEFKSIILDTAYSPRWVEDSPVSIGCYDFNPGFFPIPYMTLPASKIHMPSLTACTVSFWRKKTVNGSWLLFKGHSTSHYIMATSGGTGNFYHSNAGSPQIFVDGVPRANPIDDFNWHHYVARNVNMSSWTALYLNDYPGDWPFKGRITDIRIYNSLLSDADIMELYRGRANIDKSGNLRVYNMTETGYNPLIMRYTVWQNGQTGSVGDFIYYGDAALNKRVMASDPWGKMTVVWQGGPTTSTSYQTTGIYHNYTSINKNRMYRFSWWERRITNSNATYAYYYAGLDASPNGLKPYNSDTLDNNPYFWYKQYDQLPVNEWFLVVGHVFPASEPKGTVAVKHPDSGVWRIKSSYGAGQPVGEKIENIIQDYRWDTSNNQARSRNLSIYWSNAPGVVHQTAYPRMEVCDGTEPSLTELLTGYDSRNVDRARAIEADSTNYYKRERINISKTRNYARQVIEIMPIDGLAVWYWLTGGYTFSDQGPYGRNGYRAGGVGEIADDLMGYVTTFNGSDSRIHCDASIPAIGAVSMWVRTPTYPTDSRIIMTHSQTKRAVGFYNNGYLICSCNGWVTNVVEVSNYNTASWNHIVVCWSDSTSPSVYINNKTTAYLGSTDYWSNPSNNLTIGGRPSGSAFNGRLRDFRLYNRRLNEREIEYLYEVGKNRMAFNTWSQNIDYYLEDDINNVKFTKKGNIYLPGQLDETY